MYTGYVFSYEGLWGSAGVEGSQGVGGDEFGDGLHRLGWHDL